LHRCGDRPGTSRFTRIFRPFSSLSHVRAKERNVALLAAYTPQPGKPFTDAFDPVMMIDAPSFNSGNAFWTVNSVPRAFTLKAASKCCSVISHSREGLALTRAREQDVDLALFSLNRIEQMVEIVEICRVNRARRSRSRQST